LARKQEEFKQLEREIDVLKAEVGDKGFAAKR
jgi:hypothetical protein